VDAPPETPLEAPAGATAEATPEATATSKAAPAGTSKAPPGKTSKATSKALPVAAADSGATPPPSDYRLAVPEGWQRIVLDPERWNHRIDRIVGRGFRGAKADPRLKAAAAERLREQAAAAHANGGLAMYLATGELGGIPISAGLVVTLVPPPADGTPLSLERAAIHLGAQGAPITLVDLPAGPALRHRHRRLPSPDDPDGNRLAVTHLDIRLAVPNSPAHLLLSFSTPMEPLADALVELFDSVASTLQWMA
jgi:hypothetical protein